MTLFSRFQPTRPVWGATMADFRALYLGLFQPTRPSRGATGHGNLLGDARWISTHAPRVGVRPPSGPAYLAYRCDFNPRAPCGARQDVPADALKAVQISTHAPRVGARQQTYTKSPIGFCTVCKKAFASRAFEAGQAVFSRQRPTHFTPKGGANLTAVFCPLGPRTATPTARPPAHRTLSRQNARSCSGIWSPVDRTADCPLPGR